MLSVQDDYLFQNVYCFKYAYSSCTFITQMRTFNSAINSCRNKIGWLIDLSLGY